MGKFWIRAIAGLYLLWQLVGPLFKDVAMGYVGDTIFSLLPDWGASGVFVWIEENWLHVYLIVVAIMGIAGWGTKISVHLTKPYLRKIKYEQPQERQLPKNYFADSASLQLMAQDNAMAIPRANLWRMDSVVKRWADTYNKDYYEEEVRQILREAGIHLISKHEKSSSLLETGNPLDYIDGRKVFYVKSKDLEAFEMAHPPEKDDGRG